MEHIILQMLDEYECESTGDFENALKEIIQEIALLGLWRSKFFEHALFYGGTSLRILYQLPRFSEDLDFSLLKPNNKFNLLPYYQAIQKELEAFGFQAEIEKKEKIDPTIESAFIKAGTKNHLIKIQAPKEIIARIQSNQVLKIKVEVDTNPPGDHEIEVKDLFRPIPFQVKTMHLPDLFAGKVHAVLARKWGKRVKGRDFFDYLWYLRMKTPLHLKHLETRLIQSGHINQTLNSQSFKKLLTQKFSELDIEQAKSDVSPFLDTRERASLELWSRDYFIRSIEQINFLESN